MRIAGIREGRDVQRISQTIAVKMLLTFTTIRRPYRRITDLSHDNSCVKPHSPHKTPSDNTSPKTKLRVLILHRLCLTSHCWPNSSGLEAMSENG